MRVGKGLLGATHQDQSAWFNLPSIQSSSSRLGSQDFPAQMTLPGLSSGFQVIGRRMKVMPILFKSEKMKTIKANDKNFSTTPGQGDEAKQQRLRFPIELGSLNSGQYLDSGEISDDSESGFFCGVFYSITATSIHSDNLKKAELYEKAIEIFNQMKDLFENVIFDYDSVSRILKEQALIYQEMSVNQNRHYACYFKVGFFGQSFPGMLKNQEFIYRGGKLVRRIDIIDKLREHFPDVISVNDQQVPSKDIQEGAQKYLQITPVFALTFKEMQQFGMTSDKEELALGQKVKALPEKLRNYYVQNFKRRFFRETVIASKHTDELQKDIQIEIFKVKDKFPTIINMQNIIRTKKIIQKDSLIYILNLRNDKAIRDVKDHIERIENSKKAVQNQITQEDCEIDGLQSLVRSTLESPIQGGIQRYLNAFLNESYLHSPQDKPKVLVLFKMMEDCSAVINDAVQLLQQKSQNEIMQTKMNGDYLKFKEQLADIRSYIDQSAQLPRF